MNKNQICHLEIACSDAKQSAAFYEALFGWKINYDMGQDYILFDPEQGAGGAFSKEAQVTPSKSVVLYWQVDDIDAMLAKAVKLGGREVTPKTAIPGHGWYGKFEGPDGHIMGLFTPKE
ncbi:MAG: VOC family protein [bacterium]